MAEPGAAIKSPKNARNMIPIIEYIKNIKKLIKYLFKLVKEKTVLMERDSEEFGDIFQLVYGYMNVCFTVFCILCIVMFL